MPERRPRNRGARRSPSRPLLPTRREFLGVSLRVAALAGTEIAAAGSAAAMIWFGKLGEHVAIEQRLQEYEKKHETLESVIARFEQGFERFTGESQKLIDTSGATPEGKSILSKPFELARINKQNQDKNIYRIKIRDITTRRSLSAIITTSDNPNFFNYDLLPEGQNAAAAYAPLSRTFYISSDYDPDNTLDNLLGLHELVHVAQDNTDRQKMSRRNYEEFFADGERRKIRKIVAIYEATAFIEEIYMLNLFTQGKFREDVLRGTVDIKTYRQLLKARPDQEGVLTTLVEIASQFYRGRSSLTGIDARFLEYIAGLHRQQGMEVYDRTPVGFVRMR